MNNLRFVARSIKIALILILAVILSVMNLPIVKGSYITTSVQAISILPNPFGVGQKIMIVLYIQPAPPAGYVYDNLRIEIEEPDSFKTVLTSMSDASGTASFVYTPNLLGTYNLFFTYLGETLGNDVYRPCDYYTSFATTIWDNTPPVASFTYAPTEPKAGESIQFDATNSYDPDGEIKNYSWDFGDQTQGINMEPSHAYEASGTYTVRLRVTDNDGLQGPYSSQVTVRAQDKYQLIVMCEGNGTTDLAAGSHTYEQGSEVSVTAQSEEGWRFDYWKLDGNNFGGENPITVAMDTNHILSAIFIETKGAGSLYPSWIIPTIIGIVAISSALLLIRKRKAAENHEPLEPTKMITVLFLAANPANTTKLDLTEEVNAIDDELYKSKFRDQFNLEQRFELKPNEISEQLLRHNPQIVHFSGHGSEAGEIILEDENDKMHTVDASAISTLFSTLKGNIKCVVLNACYSEIQATLIAKHIDCVIGMSKAIGDEAAIKFAQGFYRGIGFGKDLETAFKLGCDQIDLEGLKEEDTPQIKWKDNVSKKIVLTNVQR